MRGMKEIALRTDRLTFRFYDECDRRDVVCVMQLAEKSMPPPDKCVQ